MKYIDLHVHSNISDGTLSPEELTRHAAREGLSAFALTDHDTVMGIERALKEADRIENQPLQVIPGVEISVAYRKRDIHMLGLMIDHTNKTLVSALEDAAANRARRNKKMIANLQGGGIDITMEQLLEVESSDSTEKTNKKDIILTRAHFAKFLTEHGYTKSMKEAFTKYLNSDCPYYVPREYMNPGVAINLILQAGGIPVLAHPLLYKLEKADLESLIEYLKSKGLMGIEAIYSSNLGHDEITVRNLANKYNLLITGGSDFHGSNKPDIEIGVGRGNLKIPYSILENLLNAKSER